MIINADINGFKSQYANDIVSKICSKDKCNDEMIENKKP